MLLYLLSRLMEAQGFTAYVQVGDRCHKAENPVDLLTDAKKKCRSMKGARHELTIHRYYGKNPQEGSSSVWVVLPVWIRDNGIELEPGRNIVVRQPDHSRYPKQGWDEHSVEVTRPKATWMGIVEAIEEIRAPRRRTA